MEISYLRFAPNDRKRVRFEDCQYMKRTVFIFLAVIAMADSAMAWDVVGHRVIAEVAYRHLNHKARKQVDKVLGTRGIVYYASWADEIKSDTIYPDSYGWHFQNLKSGLSHEQLDSLYHNKLAEGEHLFYALEKQIEIARADKSQADALKFIVHLVGDSFQPMHVGHPDDKGGNKVQCEWFKRTTNLHSIWDGKLIAYTTFSYTEYADFLVNRYGTMRKQIMAMTDEECIYQTYKLQNEVYKYQNEGDTNSYHYAYRFRTSLDIQLYTAGIRLAKLLNEIYG